MSIRLSGMMSGLDTDAIVQGLSSAYQVKIDKVNKKKKKLDYQTEAWTTLNSKILSFYKGALSKVKTYGNYKTKKASVSGGSNASISVKAASKATDGTYKVKVRSTASAAFLTSAKLASQKYTATYNATNSTSFSEMYDESGNKLSDSLMGKSITFSGSQMKNKLNADGDALFTLDKEGVPLAIDVYDDDGNVTGFTTEATPDQINAYLAKVKEADPDNYDESKYHVTALLEPDDAIADFTYTFDENSSVADINAKLKEAGFTGIAVTMDDGKFTIGNVAGFTTKYDGSLKQMRGTYSVSGADALNTLGVATNASGKVDVLVSSSVAKDEDGNDILDKDGNVTYEYNRTVASDIVMKYDVADTSLSNSSKLSEYLGDTFANNAQVDAETGKKYIEYNLVMGTGADAKTTTLRIDEDTKVSDFTKAIQDASGGKVTASFDAKNQRFFLNSNTTGADNSFTLEAAGSAGSQEALEKLGLVDSGRFTGDDKMSAQAATDAVIELNGATITSSTNDVKIDSLGLTITAEAADPNETLTVKVTNDTDGVYNMVKDFIKEYNNLLTEMAELYYAEKTDYEPLTEEEEGEMSDKQVEKWEEKVKKSVLRRDDSIYTLMNTMRNSLSQAVKVTNADGTTGRYSLASLGITTGEYLERGLLHIAGDSDDPEYAGKTDKLRAMLEEDPDKVMNILADVTTNLYDKMKKMAKSTELHGFEKFYNDKVMKSHDEGYDKDIKKLEEKLEAMQDKYYKQFSKMEVALSKLNSVSSSLGFGGTTGQ